jgi:hypothetical protein
MPLDREPGQGYVRPSPVVERILVWGFFLVAISAAVLLLAGVRVTYVVVVVGSIAVLSLFVAGFVAMLDRATALTWSRRKRSRRRSWWQW